MLVVVDLFETSREKYLINLTVLTNKIPENCDEALRVVTTWAGLVQKKLIEYYGDPCKYFKECVFGRIKSVVCDKIYLRVVFVLGELSRVKCKIATLPRNIHGYCEGRLESRRLIDLFIDEGYPIRHFYQCFSSVKSEHRNRFNIIAVSPIHGHRIMMKIDFIDPNKLVSDDITEREKELAVSNELFTKVSRHYWTREIDFLGTADYRVEQCE